MEHFVSKKPFDPQLLEYGEQKNTPTTAKQIMWWKFKRHRLAMLAGFILFCFYFLAIFAEMVSPYNPHEKHVNAIYAPPQTIHFFHENSWVGPFVYGYNVTLNLETLQREYVDNKDDIQPLRFLCSGDQYQFWSLWEGNFHVFCPSPEGTLFLLGTDQLGRDMLSRIIYATRISLTVGLVGITISFLLGIVIGGLAGYYGGMIDHIVQRIIEILRSLPELPLWMALSAAVPANWGPVWVYFSLTIILALLDWPGLARSVRSKFLSLREEDFCMAAKFMGARPKRIIFRHLLPNFSSHLIASVTLSIPSMILAETALSYLGLGLRAPIVSWGVLLNDAQNINVIALFPWLLWPVFPVILVILCYNFFGDGLRDAADPHKH